MPRHLPALLLSSAIAVLSTAAVASNLTPSAVLYGANQYNGQEVSVTGIISHLKLNTMTDGKPYETFTLCDANACLSVYALGATPHNDGDSLTASGHFWMFVQRGYLTFHNELDLDTD